MVNETRRAKMGKTVWKEGLAAHGAKTGSGRCGIIAVCRCDKSHCQRCFYRVDLLLLSRSTNRYRQ